MKFTIRPKKSINHQATGLVVFGVTLLLAIGCLSLSGVWAEVTTKSAGTTAANTAHTPVGGDRDAHGCVIATGQTWCDIKQKCLQTSVEKCDNGTPAPSILSTPGQKGSGGVFVLPTQQPGLWQRTNNASTGDTLSPVFAASDTKTINAGGAEITNITMSTRADGNTAMTSAGLEAYVADQIAGLGFSPLTDDQSTLQFIPYNSPNTSLATRDAKCKTLGANFINASALDVKAQANSAIIAHLLAAYSNRSNNQKIALLVSDFTNAAQISDYYLAGKIPVSVISATQKFSYGNDLAAENTATIEGPIGVFQTTSGTAIGSWFGNGETELYSAVELPCIDKVKSRLVFSRSHILASSSDSQKTTACKSTNAASSAAKEGEILPRSQKNMISLNWNHAPDASVGGTVVSSSDPAYPWAAPGGFTVSGDVGAKAYSVNPISIPANQSYSQLVEYFETVPGWGKVPKWTEELGGDAGTAGARIAVACKNP